jgi:hypothetical protein
MHDFPQEGEVHCLSMFLINIADKEEKRMGALVCVYGP